MIYGKALLVAVPLALAGGLLAFTSTTRIGALRDEIASLDAEERKEGASFLDTLQGAHAERQLQLLTRRHDAALRLATARRNRLLGVLLVLAAGLAYAAVRVAQKVAAEVDEDRRLLARSRGGAP